VTLNTIKNTARPIFPFTAIVGQEEMKLALALNVIDPKIGGVIIMGDRGTGKSTTIRAITDILPEIEVVKDDPFNSHPNDFELMSDDIRTKIEQGVQPESILKKVMMVDLPLGATEDRVCGTIDIEKALTDSAASGWNTVEREGISIRHPARFVLVGSGNPEEGELRPQLLDRFGMHSEIRTVKSPELRVQIVEQRSDFDRNPQESLAKYQSSQEEFRNKIIQAQTLLPQVIIDYKLRVKISQVCSELDVDGLRGDIVTNRASRAYAAYNGRVEVTVEDIKSVITMCLRHRLRKDPLETIDSGDKVQKTFEKVFSDIS